MIAVLVVAVLSVDAGVTGAGVTSADGDFVGLGVVAAVVCVLVVVAVAVAAGVVDTNFVCFVGNTSSDIEMTVDPKLSSGWSQSTIPVGGWMGCELLVTDCLLSAVTFPVESVFCLFFLLSTSNSSASSPSSFSWLDG